MSTNKSLVYNTLTLCALLFFAACENLLPHSSLPALAAENNNAVRLTLADVGALMDANKGSLTGPVFDKGSIPSPKDAFNKTPMGAYLNTWLPENSEKEQIAISSLRIVNNISKSPVCKKYCKPEFLNEVRKEKGKYVQRLEEVTLEIADNEMRNHERFNVFYHAFPNDFRLYQDVLRALKSFEYLTNLTTTYPFRDFAFKGARTSLPEFLKGWWPAYLEYAKEQGVPPFPHSDFEHKAASVGLSFFPDSIGYAQGYILSANVNFIGNNLSPNNSSIFYFLNSTSATNMDMNNVNKLIEASLAPYLRGENGKFDKAKFEKILSTLLKIFDNAMADSAGQVAQIFVEKNSSPEVAYPAWNGGEPLWQSRTTGKVIMAKRNGREVFRPTNVFWPTAEQEGEYKLYNIEKFIDQFINDPVGLEKAFPIKLHPGAQGSISRLFEQKPEPDVLKVFATQDYAQARVLPNPKFFTDENITGVKIFTRKPVSAEAEERYYKEIFAVVRDVIGDFLANVKNVDDFKEGDFKLKSAFINAQKIAE